MNINLMQELERIQTMFTVFEQDGSWILAEFPDGSTLDLDIGCYYKVLKILPGYDAAGNLIDTDFWLLFCLSGYEDDTHHAHVKKILELTDTEFGVDLRTADGEILHIEHICPAVDISHDERWQQFKVLVKANPQQYEVLHAAYIEDGLRRMEES
jgi:hypothetical protein